MPTRRPRSAPLWIPFVVCFALGVTAPASDATDVAVAHRLQRTLTGEGPADHRFGQIAALEMAGMLGWPEGDKESPDHKALDALAARLKEWAARQRPGRDR